MNTMNMPIVKYKGGKQTETGDAIAIEEPLEIFVNDAPFHVTMRLPGEEIPLAMGLCFTEGLIESQDDLLTVEYCRDMSSNRINVRVKNVSAGDPNKALKHKRSISYTSCGLCGKDLISDIRKTVKNVAKTTTVTGAQLASCRDVVVTRQEVFRITGGTHAAGIFSRDGELLALSEDVGRHNALDKAIGKVLLDRKQKEAVIVILTSRLSFEMVQKAACLGAEILAGVSSATSSAIELADSCELTLIGFLRGNEGNVYTHRERLA